jgi:ElaB/YqjD/DUF883 family membrane-anchored ribosome-binding protein
MANNDPYPTGTYTQEPRPAGTLPGQEPSGPRTDNIRERMSGMTNQAWERANEFGRKSAEAIDRNIDAAAGKLSNTAESLRSRAGTGGDRVSQMASTAADKLDATARYFRDHHTRDMVSGVEGVVRRNPGASICAALAIGFLLGSAMKRDHHYE